MAFTRFCRGSAALGVGLLAGAVAPQTAHAIIVADAGAQADNPAGNKVAPSGGRGWDNIGWRGFGTGAADGATAIYLGNRYVLSAFHVGAGSVTFGTDDPSGGTTYGLDGTFSPVRLTNPAPLGGLSDLVLFRIASDPGIAPIPLADTGPVLNQAVTIIGTGRTRGSTTQNSSAIPPNGGYTWSNVRDKVWGENTVSVLTNGEADGAGGNSYLFRTTFDPVVGETIVADKDSGSGVFTFDALQNRWELVGVTSTLYTFGGQPAATAGFGNQAGFVDVTRYLSQFPADVPEPGTALLIPAVAGLLALRRRRVRHSA